MGKKWAIITLLKEKNFYRRFFALTATIALQNLIVFSVNLADNIMLGAYSELAMSGVAMANQFQFLLQQISMGIGAGAAVIAAQYWGKRQTQPIRRVFVVAFWLGLAVSLGMALAAGFRPEQVLRLLTNENAVINQGAVYMRIMAFSYPIFMATNLYFSILRSVETVKIGFWVSLSTLFVNISLNYVLIYGHFGFPELGVRGAAYATLIARIIEFLIMAVYVHRFDKKLCLRPRHYSRLERGYLRDYFKTGLPLMLSSLSWGVAMNIQGAILGRLGAAAIAANAIAATLFQVISVLTYASASASSVLVGKAVGEGDLSRVRAMAKTLQLLFLGIGLCSGLLLFGARDFIVGIYKASPETAALARQFILVLCVTIAGTAYQMPCLTGIVSGGGDTRFVLFNDLIFMWGIVLPVSLLSAFVFRWPVLAAFICLKADQILKCGVAVVKVNRFRWVRKLTR